jgi:hypothetical protein
MDVYSICACTCTDGDYQAALDSTGYDRRSVVSYAGKDFDHDDIALVAHQAYMRHRGEFPVLCGAKPGAERKRQRQFRSAVTRDVGTTFGISPMTVVLAAVMFALAGPMGLVLAIVSCVFQYLLEKDLNGDKAIAACAATS